jgi:hypothetical protein
MRSTARYAAPARVIRRATTWAESLRHLQEPPHLIVCGIHFEKGASTIS